ncbi:MAG: GNAT family N-acetyltransferase [Parvularculaceae bacterium]
MLQEGDFDPDLNSLNPAMIRKLTQPEARIWQSLAIEAIEKHPECFVTTLEEERAIPLSWFEEQIPLRHVFVAGDNEGLAVLKVDNGVGHITSVYVKGEARGRGLADQLLTALCSQSMLVGCRKMVLQVFEENYPAVSLYRKHGFKIISQTPFQERTDCKFECDLNSE